MQSYYSCNRLGYNLLVLSTTSSSCPSLQASSNRGQLKKIKDSKWWHFWKLCSSRMSFICKLLQFNQKSVQPSLRAPRSIQTSRIRVNWSFKKVYDLVYCNICPQCLKIIKNVSLGLALSYQYIIIYMKEFIHYYLSW